MSKTQKIKDHATVKGFFRLQITEEGKVVGDSGWKRNLITNSGYQNYIVGSLGAIAGSSQVSYLGLGTGGAPIATDNVLAGELTDSTACRFSVTPTAVSSKTLQLTGALTSNIVTANRSISNVGIFFSSMAGGPATQGTLFAGNTYTSSQLQTNQQVNVTYQIRFS